MIIVIFILLGEVKKYKKIIYLKQMNTRYHLCIFIFQILHYLKFKLRR